MGSDTENPEASSKPRIDALKRQRSAFKGQLTQFRNRLPALATLGEIESNLRRLQLMYDKYHQVQLKIEVIDDTTSTDRVSFEEDYESVESELLDKLHAIKKHENQPKEHVNFDSSANSTQIDQSVPSMSIKLPEIKLPKFSGVDSDWLAFRDIFRDLIHNKSNIDATVKFMYLLSHIREGKAYNLIEYLPVTSDNYEVAWQTLCSRYDNKIVIQRLYMKALYDIKPPQENSSTALQAFIDNSVRNYNALKSLHTPVESWDLMLIHHLTEKLDNSSKIYIIKHSDTNHLLNFEQFIGNLRNRVRILDAIKSTAATSKQVATKRFNLPRGKSTSLVSNNITCPYCGETHLLTQCPDFTDTKLTPKMRFQFIRGHELCTNCLVSKHKVSTCGESPCRLCSLKHHKLLHFGAISNNKVNTHISTTSDPSTQSNPVESAVVQTSGVSSCNFKETSVNRDSCFTGVDQILIGTALINVTTDSKSNVVCRALLDSGSHLNFVTESVVSLLKVRKLSTKKIVSGIGGKETIIKSKVSLTISSRVSNFSEILDFFIIPTITNFLPATAVNINLNSIPAEIELADPYFHIPNKIDILLGAEVYNRLFNGYSITVMNTLPPLYSTVFGYVISGRERVSNVPDGYSVAALCTNETLHNDIKRFWELETISVKNHHSKEEKACEDHYNQNVKRLQTGRYSVSLPVNDNIHHLGFSNFTSLKQFHSIEKKLILQPETYDLYRNFMVEYESLGHMELVKDPTSIDNSYNKAYYLPHHFVLKDSSTTTKLRVVFNGSSNSSSKLSLNDCLKKGPIIQQDLLSIILRFRKHIVAFTADIAKMYRQVFVDEDHRDLQRIWWRSYPTDKIQCFRLCTVTYGTKSAPYLATRTLQQLASDEGASCPLAAPVLMNDFYVDDVLTGAETVDRALKLKLELQELLEKGGFDLRKFSSNIPSLSSPSDSTSNVSLVLGLYWITSQDEFQMKFSKISTNTSCTKRTILSEICQLFDPLGLCAPIILTAKQIMQKIWTLHNVDWDDIIPNQLRAQWINFKEQLIELDHITVPRCILVPQHKLIQIHGFADASEQGFGCVIYLRLTDANNDQHVRLVCAKSRVAPLKKQTIPRLELCAALLLVQTLTKVIESFSIQYDNIYLWSDSEITLLRIRSEPSKFATFVANRITQIQEQSSIQSWGFVPTLQNPADFVSRGLMPNEFTTRNLWWSGPSFLKADPSNWPKNPKFELNSDLLSLERRMEPPSTVCNVTDTLNLFSRYSSFIKLIRVTAYMLRWKLKLKSKGKLNVAGEITSTELNYSVSTLVKLVQQVEYSNDIRNIQKHKIVAQSSNLKPLSPFLDEDGVLRVGGRLRNSNLPYDNKHPIVLPGKHMFTKLLARSEHLRLLHCGPQTLLYSLRSQYWIIGGRNLCRQIVSHCIPCFRNKPKLTHEIMGDLPADRITQSRPFSVVGIDFCGPFFATPTIRSKSPTKIYVCLFICFVVKAVHLEIVMDLSSQAFLACLRRFISRRGYCTKLYSDNATNFIGCRAELKELRTLFLSDNFQNEAKIFCANNRIEWLTIPPRSPHFGGLWESAIKTAKWHMKRVVGLRTMTIEEYYTLVCQVEACLNSRPLTAVSNDPHDFTSLSPGHFLIGGPLLAIPEPTMLDLNTNRLSRYQLIQAMVQDFWKRWHVDYLNDLQKRYKWQKPSNNNYKLGSLVILHDENVPPINWITGRIIELHPGTDGRIRVVTIQTSKSILKRSVTKISILPLES